MLKQERLNEFARYLLYSGKSIKALRNRFGFEYKKNKSDEDVKRIVNKYYNMGLDTNTLILSVGSELNSVLNNA